MQRQNDGKHHGYSPWLNWLGICGAVLVMIVVLAFVFDQSEPEELLPTTANLRFSGASLQGETPNPIAVRLHNFITRCVAGDLGAAAQYIDPTSELNGLPEVACGPVIGMFNQTLATDCRFDQVTEANDEATVYVSIQQPPSASERYTFFMRRVKGKWYFSVP